MDLLLPHLHVWSVVAQLLNCQPAIQIKMTHHQQRNLTTVYYTHFELDLLLPHLHVWSFVAQLLTAEVELAPLLLLLLLPVHLHAICCCAVRDNTRQLQQLQRVEHSNVVASKRMRRYNCGVAAAAAAAACVHVHVVADTCHC
jgi:hypothetical protein